MNLLTNRIVRIPSFLLATLVLASVPVSGQSDEEKTRQQAREESTRHFQKWLKEDVVYIISPQEKEIFLGLTTDEEREQFIEQFWFRRDPDPLTVENEFKDEHYRRIAYSNEMFATGLKGWQSDRGKIYIIHGPPDEIQSRPSGGTYRRPMIEGGGSTQAFPHETWRYRYLEEIGSDVLIEFVDPTQSGEYRLARNYEEKDVLLHVPGAGLTEAEEYGFAQKEDRLAFSPWKRFDYRGPFAARYVDPFAQYERYLDIQQVPTNNYPDLRGLVSVDLSYNTLPFTVGQDYVKLNDDQVLVPVTIEMENNDLTFADEQGLSVAKVAVYGIVTSIANRLVREFEDDLVTSFSPDEVRSGMAGRSIYQKVLALDRKLRYKLDLVIKDLNSERVGIFTRAIIPPAFDGEELKLSSLILTDQMRQLEEIPVDEQMFVLGDFYIRPNLKKSFSSSRPLNAYLQLYNVQFDQASQQSSLEIFYTISKGRETVLEFADKIGRSIQFESPQRVILAAGFPINSLEPGKYQLDVVVKDLIGGRETHVAKAFQVQAPPTGG